MTCSARFLLLSALLAPLGSSAGCFIEQPGTQDPAYPQASGTGAQRPGAPSTATASVVTGDGTLDPGGLAAAVSSVGGALGQCFVGSGQVDMVVTLDTSGRATAVRGLGDAACLLPAVQSTVYPRPSVPTEFQVSLWVEARASNGSAAANTPPGGGAPPEGGVVNVSAGPSEHAATPSPATWRHDVFLLTVASVRVQPTRADGSPWDDGAGTSSAPDLFVKLFRNDVEVLRTDTVADVASPSFSDTHARSLRLGPADALRFEVYDDDPGTPELVTRFEVPAPNEQHLAQGAWDIGASPPMQLLHMTLAAARSMVGTGIRWEARRGALTVLEIALDSPAAAAGVEPGDRIVRVDGQAVRGVATAALEELFRGQVGTRMRLEIEHRGQRRALELERATIFY